MPELIEVDTARLRLRQWQDTDRAPFAALNADPRVMAYFPTLLTRGESDAMAARCQSLIAERGWGFWAVEEKASGAFIGFVGLHSPSAELAFSPCVEIGWRLAFAHWGKGYASEAARAALRVGFDLLGLREIVSFTTLHNRRSRALMERIGMRASGSFDHPQLPAGSHLRRHCLYRIASAGSESRQQPVHQQSAQALP